MVCIPSGTGSSQVPEKSTINVFSWNGPLNWSSAKALPVASESARLAVPRDGVWMAGLYGPATI